MGKSVFTYLTERRVQAAMWRLRSDQKILSIAMYCGFTDVN
jgi:AraC-like DNA-binding protein